MKINEVCYKRTFNLGNFENVSLELRATVDDGESVQSVFDSLATEALAWKKKKAGQ